MTSDRPTPSSPPSAPAGPPERRRFWRRPKPTAEEISDRRIKNWAELWATIILSLATLVTAWAGYEANKWNGLQTSLNLQATALRIDAGQSASKAQQLLSLDVGLFTNWANAAGNENRPLATFYRERFRDEFRPAFDAWLATDPLNDPDAPASPFELPQYRLAAQDEAEELNKMAEQLIQSGEMAGGFADQYTLTVVILAGALLLAGLANRFEWAELRGVVVAVALLILLYCVVTIIRLPSI